MLSRLSALLSISGLVAGFLTVSASPAGASTPDATIPLGVDGFQDVAVDASHVFITSGGSNGILVRDLEGAAVTTIANEPGANRMALSDDGTKLYVTLTDADAISAIDTSTLAEVARYSTGASSCPATVAVVGSDVWYGYGCNTGDATEIGVIETSADTPTAVGDQVTPNPFGTQPPDLAASPALPGKLITSSGNDIALWDVSGPAPSKLASIVSGASDLAMSSDGAELLNAHSGLAPTAYKTTDLSVGRVYGSDYDNFNSVATSSTGLVAVGIDGSFERNVRVYLADGTSVRNYEFEYCCTEGRPTNLGRHGLAFDSTGGRLYAVATDYVNHATTLKVLHSPGMLPSGLALTPPSGATFNKPFTIRGKLASVGLPGGQTVSVVRDQNGTKTNRASVQTASDGTFSITDTIAGRGTFGYTASFAGSPEHAPASKRVLVSVSGVTPSLSITTSAGPYANGAKPVVVAHLGSARLRTLSLYVVPYNSGTPQLVKRGTVDSHGDLRLAYTMTHNATFIVEFGGDSLYNPRKVSKRLLAKVVLSAHLAGYYGSSGPYKLFHTSTNPLTSVGVSPSNAGACMNFVAQRLISGSWRALTTNNCIYLTGSSHTVAELRGTHVVGTYRILPTFLGTTLNARTTGSWLYFKFTS